MKKLFLPILSSFSLYAAGPTIYLAPPATPPNQTSQEQHSSSKKQPPSSPLSKLEKEAAVNEGKRIKEMMIISPEGRAKDIEAAIKFLKQHAPALKPRIQFTNGSTLTGIIDVSVMPGGTLLIFKVASLKGVEYVVEKIENIDTLETNEK